MKDLLNKKFSIAITGDDDNCTMAEVKVYGISEDGTVWQ